MTPRRIVLTTLGSHGDLHPYVAIARGLGSATMARYMDARHGSERVARELVLPFSHDGPRRARARPNPRPGASRTSRCADSG
jgi:hypothetical protein